MERRIAVFCKFWVEPYLCSCLAENQRGFVSKEGSLFEICNICTGYHRIMVSRSVFQFSIHSIQIWNTRSLVFLANPYFPLSPTSIVNALTHIINMVLENSYSWVVVRRKERNSVLSKISMPIKTKWIKCRDLLAVLSVFVFSHFLRLSKTLGW